MTHPLPGCQKWLFLLSTLTCACFFCFLMNDLKFSTEEINCSKERKQSFLSWERINLLIMLQPKCNSNVNGLEKWRTASARDLNNEMYSGAACQYKWTLWCLGREAGLECWGWGWGRGGCDGKVNSITHRPLCSCIPGIRGEEDSIYLFFLFTIFRLPYTRLRILDITTVFLKSMAAHDCLQSRPCEWCLRRHDEAGCHWLLGNLLGCTRAHTKHASMSLAAGFVSLSAVLRDYRLRVFTGCFALDPHSTLMWSWRSPLSWLQMGIEYNNLFPIWSQCFLWGKK